MVVLLRPWGVEPPLAALVVVVLPVGARWREKNLTRYAEEHQVMTQLIWLDYELMLKVATTTCTDALVGVAHV